MRRTIARGKLFHLEYGHDGFPPVTTIRVTVGTETSEVQVPSDPAKYHKLLDDIAWSVQARLLGEKAVRAAFAESVERVVKATGAYVPPKETKKRKAKNG